VSKTGGVGWGVEGGVGRREGRPALLGGMVDWWQVGATTTVNMTFTAFPTGEAQQGNDVKLPHGRWEVKDKVDRLFEHGTWQT
jgi:hypothetical protein